MADKKISEFPIFDGVQDAQTYYILASGEAGDPDADNYKMPFTHLAQDITANISLYSGLSGVFDHLTSGASGIFTELLSGKTGAFTEELLLAGKPIVSENADGGVDLGSTEPPPAGTDAPPVNLLHGGEQKISMDDDIIVIGGVNNDPTDRVEIINPTTIKETLTVADGKETILGGTTTIKGATNLNSSLTVADNQNTTLGGPTTIKGATNLNSSLTVADNQNTTLGGPTTIKGATTFNSTANFTDSTKITFGSATPAQTLQDIIDAGGKWSDGASAGKIYYSSGNVGIGTDDPATKLHVAGNVRASSIGLEADVGFSAVFRKTNHEPAIKFQGINSGTGLNYSIGVDQIDGTNNKLHINRINDADQFVDNLLTIKSDGNVGIGTTSPDFLLDLEQKDGGVQLQMGRSNTHAGSAWMGADSTGFHLGVGAYASAGGNNSTNPNGFSVDTSGNVGIGTSPTKPLEVAQANGNSGLRLNYLPDQYKNRYNADLYYDGVGALKIESWSDSATTAGDIVLGNNGGNVGIGTSSPSSPLTIGSNNTANYPYMAFENSSTDSKNGTNLGAIFFKGRQPDDSLETGAAIRAQGNGDAANDSNNLPGQLLFQTNPGGTGGLENRMLIDKNGNVGIGTAGPSAKLNIQNGHILVEQSVNTTQENILLQGSGYKLSNGTMYGNVSIRSNYNSQTNAATLNFYTAASSISTAERMRIKSDGSVEINHRLGVGIDPVEKLDINGTAMFRDTTEPTQKSNRLYSVSGKLYWNGSELASGSSSNFAAANHTHTLSDITDLTLVSENAANTKLFLGGNTLGNTAAKNVVNGGLESVGANVQITVNNANLNPGFRLRNEQTSSTAHEEIDLQLVKNGDFVITAPKKSTGTTDLLRIANDGKIVISITPPAFDNNLGANTIFHENGFLRIKGVNDSASLGGSSNVSAINDLSDVTITSVQSDQILYYNGSKWVNSSPTEPAFISDKKYKTEIFPISEALLKVNSIKGANFTWSDDAPSDLGGKKDVGVIAQDIQKVLPEAVEEKENGDLTVKYHRIIPLLIESIKELSEENKTLKSRLDKIEGTS